MAEKREDEPGKKPEQDNLEEELRAWAEKYARDHGFVLNPDDKQLNIVIRGLARNIRKHGAQYCPCRLRSGETETDKKIICPCIYHKEEVEKEGSCHCNLYFKNT